MASGSINCPFCDKKMLEKTNLKKINFLFSSRFPRLQSMVISPISMGQQGDRASWWWEHMTVVAVDFNMSEKPETRDNVYLLMNAPVICSLQLSSISLFLLSPKCHHNENPAVFYVLIRPELSWSGHLLMTESTSCTKPSPWESLRGSTSYPNNKISLDISLSNQLWEPQYRLKKIDTLW